MKHLLSLKPDITTPGIFLLAQSLKVDPEIANELVFCVLKKLLKIKFLEIRTDSKDAP